MWSCRWARINLYKCLAKVKTLACLQGKTEKITKCLIAKPSHVVVGKKVKNVARPLHVNLLEIIYGSER